LICNHPDSAGIPLEKSGNLPGLNQQSINNSLHFNFS